MLKSIFVGNIPYGALESEIAEHFERIGPVNKVHFIMDWRKGRFRGFGFVTMAAKDADRALQELQRVKFQDRLLKLSDAYRLDNQAGNRESAADDIADNPHLRAVGD